MAHCSSFPWQRCVRPPNPLHALSLLCILQAKLSNVLTSMVEPAGSGFVEAKAVVCSVHGQHCPSPAPTLPPKVDDTAIASRLEEGIEASGVESTMASTIGLDAGTVEPLRPETSPEDSTVEAVGIDALVDVPPSESTADPVSVTVTPRLADVDVRPSDAATPSSPTSDVQVESTPPIPVANGTQPADVTAMTSAADDNVDGLVYRTPSPAVGDATLEVILPNGSA